MKRWQKICLFLIFVLAIVLRLCRVGEHPTFISDEASIGYNAYSILETGKDEWGKFLPLSFKSFGEYKLPLYIYLTVPSIAIFGLNEFAIRFPSVLFGSLTVILVFFLTKEILSKTKSSIINHKSSISLLAAFLLAISPWHIQVSRMALEANLSLFLTMLGVLLLLKAKTNFKFYYFSFFLFALTFYTYNSSRIFTPLFLSFYFLTQRGKIKFNDIFRPAVLGLVVILPIIFSGFAGSRERLYKVGLFSDPGLVAQINEKRGECLTHQNQTVCVLRYNKPVVYALTFAKNYLSHFSPRFLFSEGAGLSQYSVPGQGMLYFWEIPFIFVGLGYLFKLRKEFLFLIFWILLAPLANSLTGTAHPVRAILMLPIFQIFSAVGIIASIVFFRKRIYFRYIFSGLLALVILVSVGGFAVKYFLYYPQVANWNWQMGYKNLYQELFRLEGDYEKIYVSKFYGEPHIFYLFYRKFSPSSYQQNKDVIRHDREDKWVNVDQIGKYYFVQEPEQISLKDKELLALPLQEFSFQGETVESIKYKNGQTAFLILKK